MKRKKQVRPLPVSTPAASSRLLLSSKRDLSVAHDLDWIETLIRSGQRIVLLVCSKRDDPADLSLYAKEGTTANEARRILAEAREMIYHFEESAATIQ